MKVEFREPVTSVVMMVYQYNNILVCVFKKKKLQKPWWPKRGVAAAGGLGKGNCRDACHVEAPLLLDLSATASEMGK